MLKKLFQQMQELAKNASVSATDPAAFGDPVASTTEWTPLAKGGANFRTHKLHQTHPMRWEFRVGIATMLFCGIFILVGLVVFSLGAFVVDDGRWFMIPFGLVFATIGLVMLRSLASPAVFDKERGYFCKGRKKPERQIDPSQLKQYAELKNIHAIQIISEHVRGDKSSFYSYELNLILKDGKRLNVIDHGNRHAILQDATMLADFLKVPLWNAS